MANKPKLTIALIITLIIVNMCQTTKITGLQNQIDNQQQQFNNLNNSINNINILFIIQWKNLRKKINGSKI